MSTIQITLTAVEHGDQDWGDVLDAIADCAPANRDYKVRDGLSAPIDTHAMGFAVRMEVTA